MAIFHLAHVFLRRGNGSNSVSKAAYNSGKKIEDGKGLTEYSDYTRKGGVLYEEVSLPSGSPAWANDRGELWRRLEAREDQSTRRATALLAHNFDIALPHELTLEQNIFLAKDLIREQFTRKGYAVDWAIHDADPRGDKRNIHLHVLTPLRKIEGESFGKKDRYTRGELRKQIKAWRTSWRILMNRHLKRYGHKVQVDERSLKAQGIKRIATRHRGVRVKTQRKVLDRMRSKQPKAPKVRTAQHTGKDGSVRVQKTIAHSALNKISPRPTSVSSLSGKATSAARPQQSNNARGVTNFGHGGASTQSYLSPVRPGTVPPVRQVSSAGSVNHATKHIGKDGSVSMRVKLTESELRSGERKSVPAPPLHSRKGWPPAALRDWALWGSKNPARFFALWPELSTGGGGLQL